MSAATAGDPIDLWWQDLRTAALIGTERRDVPDPPASGVLPPGPAGGRREPRLLVAAALGDALRRAGRTPAGPTTELEEAAPTEVHPVAVGTAVQVLTLLLQQPPVRAQQRLDLLSHWMSRAAATHRLVPPRLLPVLLDLATAHEALRPGAADVVGHRGHWLARHNPDWDWLASSGVEADGQVWERLSVAERITVLVELRRTDPAAGRELVLSTWSTDAAKDRSALLGALVLGLSTDDEDFLESCLDDRAKGVREEAVRLLDHLPGSRRSERMAARLRPLLRVGGTLRRSLELSLPDEPDQAGVRDGLTDPGPGVSKRAWWLRRIVAAAPLSVWTTTTGHDAARTLAMIRGGESEIALVGLREAARLQGDVEWARTLVAAELQPSLLALLPGEEAEEVMVRHLRRTPLTEATTQLSQLSRPWGPALSRLVVEQLRAAKDPGHVVRLLGDVLGTALHPSAMPAVESWLARLGPDDDRVLRTVLRDALQFQSLHTSISEALP